jgi:hypothetical protein
MTLRLDDRLKRELEQERKVMRVSSSVLVRQALTEFLARRLERKFAAELVRAAKRRNPEEDRALAEEALYFDNESLSVAEKPASEYPAKRPAKRVSRKRR